MEKAERKIFILGMLAGIVSAIVAELFILVVFAGAYQQGKYVGQDMIVDQVAKCRTAPDARACLEDLTIVERVK